MGADTRVPVLDGWRAVSILAVLACHLVPLGPKAWQLNDMAGPFGMALFFTLSGFLITRFLLTHDSVLDFLIRRVCRIVPLAWLGLGLAFAVEPASIETVFVNLLFYANLPPQRLTEVASHYWSLCVEFQFYMAVALLVSLTGRRGLRLLPVLCVAVTVHRVVMGAEVDIVTWRRIDEILAGACLAMAVEGVFGTRPVAWLQRPNAYALIVLLAVTSHPAAGAAAYFRPYVAAVLVGCTLAGPPELLGRILAHRVMGYIAAISYALYVYHHILMFTWLGTGERLARYTKRPLLIALTFLIAHLSTFHFEQRFIAWGRALSQRLQRSAEAAKS